MGLRGRPAAAVALVAAVAAVAGGLGLAYGAAGSSREEVKLAPEAVARAAYVKLPLRFEPNRGQADRAVKFVSRGAGYSLFLTRSEAVLSLSGPPSREAGSASRTQAPAVVRMRPVGANPRPRMTATERLAGQSNYVAGNDPGKWRTGVPGFANVRYREVYPGVDLVYHGARGKLEYDFVVAPGADPKAIAVAFKGAERMSLDARGGLTLRTAQGSVRQEKPFLYQRVDGVKRRVAGSFQLEGTDRVGFRIGAYDRKRELVIDPTISYSTFLGGSGADSSGAIAVDGAGSAYVTGVTSSSDFPTRDAAQSGYGGARDAFVTKLTPDGKGLVYSTYLGGGGGEGVLGSGTFAKFFEGGHSVAVDASGSAYVTGATDSLNFPTKSADPDPAKGPYQPTLRDTTPLIQRNALSSGKTEDFVDAFVAKLGPTGALAYSTYIGGNGYDAGLGIAVDASGTAYVTGEQKPVSPCSTACEARPKLEFPTTTGAQKTTGGEGFMTKLNPHGSGLSYSTLLNPTGAAIAVDGSGAAYLTGSAHPLLTPVATTAGAHQPTAAGGGDAFVTILEPDAVAGDSDLLYSSYLGGSGSDAGTGIAVDSSRGVYLTGRTDSADFPTKDPAQGSRAGRRDAFVTKLEPDAVAGDSDLVYSTYLGGGGDDEQGSAIAVNASKTAYVTGHTSSDDFPIKDPVQAFSGGEGDAFLAKLSADGGLAYSSFLGGDRRDEGRSVAVDASGVAHVAGQTDGGSFPTTTGAWQASGAGFSEAFVAKVAPTDAPTVADIQPRRGPRAGGTGVELTGARFSEATAVHFGEAAARFRIVSDTKIVATSPRHGDGEVFVTVTGPRGTSGPSPLAKYRFFGGWERTGETASARYGHTASLLADGRVLVTGGCNESKCLAVPPLKSAELYDPKAGSWASAGEMAEARFAHTSTLLPDGRVLVTGGLPKAHESIPPPPPPLPSAELYDPQTNRWSAAGRLTEGRYGHTATLLPNGKVLVVGAGAELYDPAAAGGTGASTAITGAPPFLNFHTATLLPSGPPAACGSNCGKVLLVGMPVQRGNAAGDGDVFGGTEVYLYNPTSNAFEVIVGPNTPRFSHAATLLASGKVLVTGGRGDPDVISSRTGVAEVYDPAAGAAGAWRYAATLEHPRKGHAAQLLPDGTVLVAGGLGGALLAQSLVFDPAAGSEGRGLWFTAGVMNVQRDMQDSNESRLTGPTATLLSSSPAEFKVDPGVCGVNCGKVLVLGGSADRAAELYTGPDPAPPAPGPGPGPGSGSGDGGAGAGGVATGGSTGGSAGGGGGAASTSTTSGGGGAQVGGPTGSDGSAGAARAAELLRARAFRGCLRRVVTRYPLRSSVKSSRAYRRTMRLRRLGTAGCVKRHGRTPAAVTGLAARAVSPTGIVLSFRAPGSDGRRLPPARAYLVKQSLSPIRGPRDFLRARTLCAGACRFSVTEVGAEVELKVGELRPRTRYYYAVAALDNVTRRVGPRSNSVRARTR